MPTKEGLFVAAFWFVVIVWAGHAAYHKWTKPPAVPSSSFTIHSNSIDWPTLEDTIDAGTTIIIPPAPRSPKCDGDCNTTDHADI